LDLKNDHRRYAVFDAQRQYSDSSDLIKQKLEAYLIDQPCEVCNGEAPETGPSLCFWDSTRFLIWRIYSGCASQDKHNILAIASSKLPIWYSGNQSQTAISPRWTGLPTLDRPAMTLSGEAQRIRLATQIGSGLTGVLTLWMRPVSGYINEITGACCKR